MRRSVHQNAEGRTCQPNAGPTMDIHPLIGGPHLDTLKNVAWTVIVAIIGSGVVLVFRLLNPSMSPSDEPEGAPAASSARGAILPTARASPAGIGVVGSASRAGWRLTPRARRRLSIGSGVVAIAALLLASIFVVALPSQPDSPPTGRIQAPAHNETIPSVFEAHGVAQETEGWDVYLITHDLWNEGLYQSTQKLDVASNGTWNATIYPGDNKTAPLRPFMLELRAVRGEGRNDMANLLGLRAVCDYDTKLPLPRGSMTLDTIVIQRGAFVPHNEPPQCAAQRPPEGTGEFASFDTAHGSSVTAGNVTLTGRAGGPAGRYWHLVKYSPASTDASEQECTDPARDPGPYWPQGRVNGPMEERWEATLDLNFTGTYHLWIGYVDDAADTAIKQWIAERTDDPSRWREGMCTFPDGFKPVARITLDVVAAPSVD